jgi:hypothetical protein
MKKNLVWPIGIISSAALLALTTILPWASISSIWGISVNVFDVSIIGGVLLILLALATVILAIFHLVIDKKGVALAMGITGTAAGAISLIGSLVIMGRAFSFADFGFYLALLMSITLIVFSILSMTIKPKKAK